MIARNLGLRPATVRNHLVSVYRKFGVRSQYELLELLAVDDSGEAANAVPGGVTSPATR
jgi:DNA-binding NarL/FixJ family response regulator